MSDSDLVSVIIPVYNCEKYLEESFCSLTNQVYKNFEVVFIEDGSNDNSQNVIKELIRQNFSINATLHINSKNEGEARCRNIGINLAKGRFICFLDADDTYEPDFLFLMKEKILAGFDFVYCGFDITTQQGEIIKFESKRKYLENSDAIIKEYLRARNHFSHVASIYRKQFLEKNKLHYNENCRFGVDVEFICNLLLCQPKCSSVRASLYNYRQRANSITTSLSEKNIIECLDALSRVQKRIPSSFEKFCFIMTRKANMAFHLIEEAYIHKLKRISSFSLRIYMSVLFITYVLMNPNKGLNSKNAKALFFFHFN